MTKSAILFLVVALMAPAAAQAACKRTEIGGSWAVYATADKNTDTGFWTYCTLNLKNTGELSGSDSTCKTVGQPKSTVYAGKFKVKRNCRVVGSFGVYGNTHTIKNAWMTVNRQSFTGVGISSETSFSFNAVRK